MRAGLAYSSWPAYNLLMHRSNPDYSMRGPYAVGVIETRIPSPPPEKRKSEERGSEEQASKPSRAPDSIRMLPTEIWYPAESGQNVTEDAEHPFGIPHRATPGLRPLDASCTLIAFSHGNSGLRQQSTFLTTQLASWGFVVAAPDHVGNTFSEMTALPDEEARRSAHRRIRGQRPHDLHAVIRALLDDGHLASERPSLDPKRAGLLGHSFGGWTALKVPALEPRVAALCGLAPASEPFVGRKAFDSGELPLPKNVISLVLAARDDVLVDLNSSIRPLCDRLGPDSEFEIIDRADHFHFCDAIEMLHEMHVNNPRPNQLQPTRPMAELRNENDMHTILNERVTRFFAEKFGTPGTRP